MFSAYPLIGSTNLGWEVSWNILAFKFWLSYWVPAVIQFVVFFFVFWQDFCSRVLFLANPDLVHGLFLVIL
jgi:hypothetical protein